MAAKMLKTIRALAIYYREQGDHEMAEGFTALGNDVESLCNAIIAERRADDAGDTLAHLEARLHTTSALLKFTDAEAIRGSGPRTAAEPEEAPPEAPRRAVVMKAEIEADSRHDLASHLFNLANQIDRDGLRGPISISGGYSSGHIIELTENSGPTHDEWAASLSAYLHAKRAETRGGKA